MNDHFFLYQQWIKISVCLFNYLVSVENVFSIVFVAHMYCLIWIYGFCVHKISPTEAAYYIIIEVASFCFFLN